MAQNHESYERVQLAFHKVVKVPKPRQLHLFSRKTIILLTDIREPEEERKKVMDIYHKLFF